MEPAFTLIALAYSLALHNLTPRDINAVLTAVTRCERHSSLSLIDLGTVSSFTMHRFNYRPIRECIAQK